MSKMEKINTEWKTTAMARKRRRGEPAMVIGGWARVALLLGVSGWRLRQMVGDEAQDRDDAFMGSRTAGTSGIGSRQRWERQYLMVTSLKIREHRELRRNGRTQETWLCDGGLVMENQEGCPLNFLQNVAARSRLVATSRARPIFSGSSGVHTPPRDLPHI